MDELKRTRKKHRYTGVRPRSPGKWIIDYRDHNDKRIQKVFRGIESDAANFRRQLLVRRDKIKAGLVPAPETLRVHSFNDIWNLFVNEKEMKISTGSLSSKTLKRYKNTKSALDKYHKEISSADIKLFEPTIIEGFKVHRIGSGVSPEGVNVDLRNLRAVFRFAVKSGYLSQSPMDNINKIKNNNSDVRFLNEHELTAISDVLSELDFSDRVNKDAHDLFIFYLFTGARASEILRDDLTWSDIGRRSIHFSRTKGNKSRKIGITEPLRNVIESRKQNPIGPFRMAYKTANKRIRMIYKKAKITNATIHTLKKTAGAWYYMATRDIFATSRWLGHSTVLVTQKHYAGLIQSLSVEYDQKYENEMEKRLLYRSYLGDKRC